MLGRLLCRFGRHRRAAIRWYDARHFATVCERGCGHVFSSGYAPVPTRATRRRLAKRAGERLVEAELPRQAIEQAL